MAALSHTGRLVTSAALILALSFLSLSTNPDLPVRVIATGLAVGLLIDAFVLRALLVETLVALMSRRNRRLPQPLAKAMRVSFDPGTPAL